MKERVQRVKCAVGGLGDERCAREARGERDE